MVNESNISNLLKDSHLNTKLTTLATKAELKAEQDKIVQLRTDDLNFFRGNIFLVIMVQGCWAVVKLLVGNQRGYLLLNLSHYILLSYITQNFFGYRIRIQFDNGTLAVEQNNYAANIVNTYIVYDLDT